MPPTPHIEIIEQMEKELNDGMPASQERLQELRDALPALRLDPDFAGLQKRVNALLERSREHWMATQDTHTQIDVLRAQVNTVPVTPNPPEFTRPSSGPARLDPGPRRPVLGGALLGGGALIGGTLGLSALWQFLSHPVETSKSIGKTLLAVGAVGALAVGGWFGFNAMNWREVGQTLRGLGGSLGGAVTGTPGAALDGIASAALALTPTIWHQYLPDFVTRRRSPEQLKKEQETKKKEEEEQKTKEAAAKKVAETLVNAADRTIHLDNEQVRIGGHDVLPLAQHYPLLIGSHRLNILRESGAYVFVLSGQRYRLSNNLNVDLGGVLERAQVVHLGTPPQDFLKADGAVNVPIFGRQAGNRYFRMTDDLPTFLQAMVNAPASGTTQVPMRCYIEHTRANATDVRADDIVLGGNTVLRVEVGRTIGITRA